MISCENWKLKGSLVINSPEAIQNAANKYHASYLLAKAGLPAPETVAVQNLEAALEGNIKVRRFRHKTCFRI